MTVIDSKMISRIFSFPGFDDDDDDAGGGDDARSTIQSIVELKTLIVRKLKTTLYNEDRW